MVGDSSNSREIVGIAIDKAVRSMRLNTTSANTIAKMRHRTVVGLARARSPVLRYVVDMLRSLSRKSFAALLRRRRRMLGQPEPLAPGSSGALNAPSAAQGDRCAGRPRSAQPA